MRRDALEPLTYQEFLDFVADKEGRYEYVDGHAIGMGIPSDEHQDLALILGSRLHEHLRGSKCKVRLAARLWTGANERAPDLLVTCDEADLSGSERDVPARTPKLVIEILSPNRSDDLTTKLAEYQDMASIEEYGIVDAQRRWVRRYYRATGALFVFDHDSVAGPLSFESIGFTLDIDELYREAGLA